ncbi:MAG: hypothetical protein JWO37_4090 [Acidimicrobiales bacterium]|jgi:hypothetical protein|nr:hypothetical protein [Acidimicrobiales bacterium]
MAAQSIPTRHAVRATAAQDDELPDTALFWRWVGKAVRPYAGWIITGVGIVFIVVGYLGVSREALVAKQLPYLISGGIGGIALVGIGAVFLGTEDIRRDSGRLDRLEAMVEELHAVLLSRRDAPAPESMTEPPEATAAQRNGQAGILVALPVGQSFHRPDCVMIQGKDKARQVTGDDVRDRALKACRLCEPGQPDVRTRA